VTDWGAPLRRHRDGSAIEAALRAALDAVDPTRVVAAALHGEGPRRSIAGVTVGDARVHVLALGKAAVAMARPVLAALGPARATVVTKVAPAEAIAADVIVAGHPTPNAASERAAAALAAHADALGPDDLAVVLLSGGASSLVCAPAPGLSRADIVRTTAALLSAGADIVELNTVRRRLDTLKGGGLARRLAPARVVTLVLSDVIGDDLAVIGSGPTVADPTAAAQARAILAAYAIEAPAVTASLRDETDAPVPIAPVVHEVVASNATAVQAAMAELRLRGRAAVELALVGDAATAGEGLARAGARTVVAGGETVVRAVAGGTGGRNQHLALAAALSLSRPATIATLATDGEDGPTDAAGAVVDETTVARAEAAGLDPSAALAGTDSHPLLDALGDLLRPGATGTNVCDVAIACFDDEASG
jgi:hydroxypyruvate reductase